jgi:hypothetical protein
MTAPIPPRLKPVLAAIAALTLTAGAALAGQPAGTPVDGLAIAAQHSGLTVPPNGKGDSAAPEVDEPDADAEDEGEPAEAETDEQTDEAETDQQTDEAEVEDELDGDGEHCVDPATLTADELADVVHGWIVCWAAHQETPEGYDNHGQWVSEWARANHGGEVQANRSLNAKGKGRGR